MLVAVDIGNTNIVLGFLDGDPIAGTYRITTKANHTSDEYGLFLTEFLRMSGFQPSDVDDVIICSVVPKVMHSFRSSIVKFLDIDPMVVGPGIKTGMNIQMDNPKTVGSDQIVDAVAASHEHPLPLVVIDMGTATTLCTVDKKGNYIGGVILPGLKVSLNSLSSKTAQLPYISLEVPSHVIGKNTIDCMRSGIIYGNVDMIDGILDRMALELGEVPTIIATGGLSRFIAPLCRHNIIVDDALLLKGLLILYRKNTQ